MGKRFDGRVAVVTGASRGIGLAVAERLVSEGARVCLTARKPEPLAEAVEALGGGDVALGVPGKAQDAEHQADACAQAVARFGRLDLLVNNTGINPVYGPLLELDLDAARKVVEVNALAALSWTQQAVKAGLGSSAVKAGLGSSAVKAGPGGAVVNMSSVAGLRPSPGIAFYGATKAMLSHLTQELAVEMAPDVRVNAVAPAVVKTRFATALYEGREEEVSAAYPLGRLGVPDDVAGAVAYLASDDAAWVTGQTLVVDGGVTLAGGV